MTTNDVPVTENALPSSMPAPIDAVDEAATNAAAATGTALAQPLEACLLHLLQQHGRAMSIAALRATVAHPDVWTLREFIDAAESLGFSATKANTLAGLRPVRDESILLLKPDGAPMLWLDELADGSCQVWQPGGAGAQTMPRLALEASASVICLRAPARVAAEDAGTARGRHGHWFWGPIFAGRSLFWRTAIAASLTNIFALASSAFSMIVYDRVIPNNAQATLMALLAGVGIVLVFDFVIRLLRAYFLDVAGARADMEIADAVFDHVLDLDLRTRRGAPGMLASVLREYETLRDFFTSSTLTTVIDIPFSLLFIGVLVWIGGPMAWVPVVAIPLMLAVAIALQPHMKRQSQLSQEDGQMKQAVLVETLSGLETIKSLGAGAVMRRRWQDAVAHQARIGLDSRQMAQFAGTWANFVYMASQIAVVTIGVYLAVDGSVGTGAIVAASILCGRAVQPFAQIAQLLMRLHQSLASLRALQKVMALPREHPPGQVRMAHDRLSGSIELRDVTFRYPDQSAPVLDKVSIQINAGDKVAVIGRVGSGKSTLVKLILGLYQPQDGALFVGGHDLRQLDPADLRRNIGSVLQDVWLTTGTLRQNIALGADAPGDDEILRVAQIAGVHEFAAAGAKGYQTPISEHGEGLSGGQRQQVGIARAMVGAPPIFLFDEPTSAMDPTAERLLLQRLKEATQGATVVLITHKPSMLELVDKVILLDKGKVLAQGPKAAVLKMATGQAGPIAGSGGGAAT